MTVPSPGSPPSPVRLPIDADFLRDTLLELLVIPSPSGRTDAVMQHVGELLAGRASTWTSRGEASSGRPSPACGRT